ncbi:NeuD/PglB/VioB family sugar acetyltransferase [Alkaliphilus peptidifermentans]|uniref:Sugar O-acyltransferase, sialic acid O-acetyltransferase NeuD family n=1 Tax=Alkaliphilus peptidifermentans DSM 18978 TaxID=1120976 RepID=A0A1G5JFK2_9FIRM|nr:NeuD/PglB/VioB family sugar acetyltransferase [Alkaliphilus peptidifermentans]SCY86681.1 sugar O-acyltransferase, sialic acid O-acetyltransferase NeuD family [Alkaliphilus peptidifermentans DSM 18978]
MSKKVIIIGGPGNGTVIGSVIENIARHSGEYELIGYLNDGIQRGTLINGYPVLGPVQKDICQSFKDVYFVYALISVGKAQARVEKLKSLGIPPDRFCNIIHPSVVIGSEVKLGHGVIMMPNVVISPNATIEDHVQIYANSLVGHDTSVASYSFIANHASIGSKIKINEGAHIGSNSSIVEGVSIGEWSLIGLGSVVLKDVEPYDKVVGNPAKSIGSVYREMKDK